MAITINSNVSSSNVLRLLGEATSQLQTSFERLSSGLRINRASDDPAGLSISSGLNVDNRVYTQAIRNANDAVSLLNVAEGATTELSTILVRLRELAQQSANGTVSLDQRRALDEEAASLVSEFNRIASSTTFNNLNLLEAGSAATGIQIGYGTNGSIQLQVGDFLEHAAGTGTYTNTLDFGQVDVGAGRLATADFNGDGILDIAQSTGGTEVYILLGNGDGTFNEDLGPIAEPNGDFIGTIAAGDFNGDGIPDLIMTSDTGNYTSFLGNGDGSMTENTQGVVDGTFIPTAVDVGDFDNNGTLDLAFSASGQVITMEGSGTGSFSNKQLYLPAGAGTGNAVEFGDFNGDGNLDIAAASGGTSQYTSVYFGDGVGGFTLTSLSQSAKGGILSVGDINNDGYDDIVNTTQSGRLDVHLGSAGGTFTNSLSYYTSGYGAISITLADGNNDGLLDIMAFTSSDVIFNAGNGDGTFDTAVNTSTPGTDAGIFGDFNSDGVLDAVSGIAGSQLSLLTADTEQSNTLPRLYLLDQEGALAAFGVIDQAMERISQELGTIGATVSRVTAALNTLQVARDNLVTAESRIRDADVAENSADLLRTQIIQQSAIGVLGQANQLPDLALKLLTPPES